jgi:hypothetical protein
VLLERGVGASVLEWTLRIVRVACQGPGLFGEPGCQLSDAVYDRLEATRVGDEEDRDYDEGEAYFCHGLRIHLRPAANLSELAPHYPLRAELRAFSLQTKQEPQTPA